MNPHWNKDNPWNRAKFLLGNKKSFPSWPQRYNMKLDPFNKWPQKMWFVYSRISQSWITVMAIFKSHTHLFSASFNGDSIALHLFLIDEKYPKATTIGFVASLIAISIYSVSLIPLAGSESTATYSCLTYPRTVFLSSSFSFSSFI